MKLIAALAMSVPMLFAQSDRPAAPHSVTAVRHWSLPGVTRVAIEVSGDFHFRTDRLHDPERIYFDILDARPRIESHRFFSEEIDDKLVKRIRAAERSPGITRIVLELNGEVEATTSQLANPNRLIIELRGGAPVPAAPLPNPAPPAVVTAAPPKVEPPVTRLEPPAPKVEAPAPKPEPPAFNLEPPVSTAAVPAPPLGPIEIPKAARHTSTGNNSLTRALGLKIARVVIDAGHGGHDQGTEGPKGLLEKDLVLDVALRLGKLVESRMGAEVIYTRSEDTYIPLEQRTAIANEK